MDNIFIYAGIFAVLWLYSFFSVLINDFKNNSNKIVWILLLIFLPISAVLYPFIGKKQLKNTDGNYGKNMQSPEVIHKPIKKKKSKIFAILLNIFFPGIGYLYVGKIKRAFWFTICFYIFIYGLFYLSIIYSSIYTTVLSYFLIILVYLYLIYNVFNIIKKEECEYTQYNKWYFMILFFFLYLGYIFIVKTYAPIRLFSSTSNGMSYTIIAGDRVIAKCNNFIPSRGDVVVFKYPNNQNVVYVKRCVALGGDEILYANKTLYLRLHEGDEYMKNHFSHKQLVVLVGRLWIKNPYLYKYSGIHYDQNIDIFKQMNLYMQANQLAMKPAIVREFPKKNGLIFNAFYKKVPQNKYFMMGDNRDHSNDSRFWGSVPQKYIIGQVKLIFINYHILNRSGTIIK